MTSRPSGGLDPLAADVGSLREAVPALHAWYRASARDLPWRRTRDPYAIWVSEVMLQQTRVATVVPYFERWMAALPTAPALAAASEDRVFHLWEGLGYYSRARNLHRAARVVVESFGGEVPREPAAFRALPGVGPYTAAAVLSLAFGLDLPVLDGNVLRVLGRLTAEAGDPRSKRAFRPLEALALDLLPPGTAATHNQALMELGARVCTPRSPDCGSCPLAGPCRARRSGDPERYPGRRARGPVPHAHVALGIVLDEAGQVFIDRRPYGGLLAGLWEFPGGKIELAESPEDALVRELREEFGMEVEVGEPLPAVDHAYTHLRVTLHPRFCRFLSLDARAAEGRPWLWVPPADLANYAMPRANRKVIEHLRGRLP